MWRVFLRTESGEYISPIQIDISEMRAASIAYGLNTALAVLAAKGLLNARVVAVAERLSDDSQEKLSPFYTGLKVAR